jgi:micrococcal nuclease
MKKRHALILSLLVTGIIASQIVLFSLVPHDRETVTISRVIDGDTLVLADGRHIRLLNINAPEKGTAGSELSADFLRQFTNSSVSIEITGLDKYSRTLARIYSPNYLNLELVRQGMSSKFLVDSSELHDFASAENSAIKSGAGIWVHSPYFGCVRVKIDPLGEKVDFSILCADMNTTGWYLKDESRKVYKFGCPLTDGLTLFSGNGKDNETTVFWNQGDVWNNDRDTLYLFDSDSRIVLASPYGY